MSIRKQRTVQFPLSKANELKIRKFYKSNSNLSKNANEESVFRSLGIYNRRNAYNAMGDLYNKFVNNENSKISVSRTQARKTKSNVKKENKNNFSQLSSYDAFESVNKEREIKKTENKEIKKFTFIIHLEIEITYKEQFYEKVDDICYPQGMVIQKSITTEPTTGTKSTIADMIEEHNFETNYKKTEVISSRVEYMNTSKILKNKKPKIHQSMKRSYVLRNDWLSYSHGIATTAYESTEDRCVYYQLTNYLLNPDTGRPSPFISFNTGKKRPTSEETLFQFFQEKINEFNLYEQYPDFSMESGVSSKLISLLCENLKRNMYAYDEDNKIFDSITSYFSKHHSPIIYYKLHGHCYLIDDPKTIRCVAESNKKSGIKIISLMLEDTKETKEKLPVYLLDSYDVSKSKEMSEGIYLINQSKLDDEIVEFITTFKSVPLTKTSKSNVVQIKFEVGLKHTEDKKNRKFVIICIDATHGENYNHTQLTNVAKNSGIDYVNEGIGSVILSILENGGKSCRESLSETDRKEFLQLHNHTCKVCKMKCDCLEIDHTIPIASGGDNSTSNLQPLCPKCHQEKTTNEAKSGAYEVKDVEYSVFNQVVLDNIIRNKEWNAFQFVETVPFEMKEQQSELGEYKIDMKKCRRNITYQSKYEFPVYCVMDIPRPFSGNITCGMYYVETDDCFPFRGCGWYSHPIIEYGLQNKIIKLNEIQMEFLPSVKLPPTHFQKPIDILLKAFEVEPTIQKNSINSLIGLFGRTKSSASKTKFTLSNEEASLWWGDKDPRCEVFIKTITLDNKEKLYEGIFNEPVEVEGLKYPIYKQILEMEACELHKLESIIRKKGGIILDRNTDAIRYARKESINTDNYFWDDEKTIVKYQKEEAKPLTCEKMRSLCREKMDMSVYELHWNTQDDYEGTAEEEASNIVDRNISIHIDGKAGTGKTYLVNKIIDELKTRCKNYLGFCPTNKASLHIQGNTIDSMYYEFQSNKKKLFSQLEKIDYIFIDEVSMMIKDFYQLFILLKRSFKNIRFIIAGDFGQLPPVLDNWTGDYKNSPAMYGLCDGNRIELMKCRRSNRELFDLYCDVKSIDINRFKLIEPTYLNIAYTHETRIKVNKQCMNRYLEENKVVGVFIGKDKSNPKTQDVKLAKGMPLIAHTTYKKMKILNSQTFTITDVSTEYFTIKNGEFSQEIKIEKFHELFYLGFCITIYASQGETFHTKYTIYDWNFTRFCDRAKYVAMSRGRNINNIQIA